MNHDEILAKIAKLSITPETNVVPSELATALMAVVELHSYILYKNTETDEMYEQCHECSGNGYHALYPCLTIQAIEKELS
ncbi:MAG: hypothetical protein EBU08_10055 [Micrococcales bacterium]|nr:hypothetical protein [Micrococcales bacterium]NBS86127.1 hypothetical protein [Micrococcales bacterium]